MLPAWCTIGWNTLYHYINNSLPIYNSPYIMPQFFLIRLPNTKQFAELALSVINLRMHNNCSELETSDLSPFCVILSHQRYRPPFIDENTTHFVFSAISLIVVDFSYMNIPINWTHLWRRTPFWWPHEGLFFPQASTEEFLDMDWRHFCFSMQHFVSVFGIQKGWG